MKRTVLAGLKALSVAALLAGVALVTLPAAGCAQQKAQVRVAGEKERDAEVAHASDVQPAGEAERTGETKRIIVTKHGPRRR